ncbi:hypothetical protein [Pseudomonas sp. SDO5271_S396]
MDETTNRALGQLNETATRIGFELFSLESYHEAEQCLTIAAAQGNVEAQYAMATCVTRRDGRFYAPSDETRKWLGSAAAQHHIPSLMRLGDTDSLHKANELLQPKANAGDTQAMGLLYTLTNNVSWLNMAVSKGDHAAEFQLAQAYRKTPGLIPNAVERNALIEELLQKAADGGNLEALAERIFSRDSTASVPEKQQRLIQLAGAGQMDALLEYGYALASMPRSGEGMSNFAQRHPSAPRTYGLEKDFAKAYALLDMALSKMTDYAAATILEKDMDAIWHQMTSQQHLASKAIANSLQAAIPRVFKSMSPLILLGRLYD